jgi:hypothetical protein
MDFKKEEIKSYALEQIQELKKYDLEEYNQLVQDGDLHNRLFNEDYYIIGTFEAKEWLQNKVFEVMEFVKDYEIDNFGESHTELTNPEKLVNMYVYILGEIVLGEILN